METATPTPAAQKTAAQLNGAKKTRTVRSRNDATGHRSDVKKPAAKSPAKKATGKKAPPPRKARFTDEMKITVVAKENPKREGTAAHKAFARYKSGMTVAEAIKAGVRRADLSYDTANGHITIK